MEGAGNNKRLQRVIRRSGESGGVKQEGESSRLETRQPGGCCFLNEGDDAECLLAFSLQHCQRSMMLMKAAWLSHLSDTFLLWLGGYCSSFASFGALPHLLFSALRP